MANFLTSSKDFVVSNANWFKLLTGLLALSVLVYQVDLNSLLMVFGKTNIPILLLSFVLFAVLVLLGSWRLHLLIQRVTGSFLITLRLVLVGYFFNSFLPGGFGGDGYKVVALKQRSNSWSNVLTLVTLDRMLGVLLVLLAGVAYLLAFGLPSGFAGSTGRFESYMVSPMWLMGGTAITVLAFAATLYALWHWRLMNRVAEGIQNIAATLAEISMPVYLSITGLSVLVFLARLIRFYLYVECFGMQVPLIDLVLVLFLMHVVMLIPVTVGGLGLQEGAITLGLVGFGVPLPVAFAVSLLNRMTLLLAALIGGVIFSMTKARTPDSAVL